MRSILAGMALQLFSRIAGIALIALSIGGSALGETFDRGICFSPGQNDRVVLDPTEFKSTIPQDDRAKFGIAAPSLRTLVKEKIRKFRDYISAETECSEGKCTIQINGDRVQGQIKTGDVLDCFSTVKACAKGTSDCDAILDEYIETIYWPGGVVTLRQSRLSHERASASSDLTARGLLTKQGDPNGRAGAPIYSEVFDLDRRNSLELQLTGNH